MSDHPVMQMNLLGMWHPPGAHIGGWRMPEAVPGTDTSFAHHLDIAKMAEAAKLDALFYADVAVTQSVDLLEKNDPLAGMFPRAQSIEPMTLIAALATQTAHIGLVATGSSTYSDPYTIARRFSAVDQISGGRAGWNLVTSQFEAEAGNYGAEAHMPHGERYKRAEEFFDVVAALWDSWAEGAVVEDKETARIFDDTKVRLINHKGDYFRVKGPLNEARSPQGRPIVAQAGSSGPGKALAARVADVVFTAQSEPEDARAFRAELKSLAKSFGRNPDEIKVFPGLTPIVGETPAEAEAHYLQLQERITDDQAIRGLQRIAGGLDLTKFPLDGPLPDLPVSNGARSRQKRLTDMARAENLTLRQAGRRFAESKSHFLKWGTPAMLADVMQEWFESGACDGFCIIFPYYRRGVSDFLTLVVPELQRRGLFRTEYTGKTLRENLGLSLPPSYFDA